MLDTGGRRETCHSHSGGGRQYFRRRHLHDCNDSGNMISVIDVENHTAALTHDFFGPQNAIRWRQILVQIEFPPTSGK